MMNKFKTQKGLVIISDHYVFVKDKTYTKYSEQLSIGEWETWDLQEVESYIVVDPDSEDRYFFVLYYDHDWELQYAEEVLHEDVSYFTYRLTKLEK